MVAQPCPRASFSYGGNSGSGREILVQHLLVKEDDLKLLLELQQRISGRVDLSDLVVEYSIFPSKEDGGMLGWARKGQMVPEFKQSCKYPHGCRLLVLYTCVGVLLLILSLLLLRLAIFGTLWIILQKRVWFFPNILAEEKDEEECPKWTARLLFAVLAVLYQKRVSNIIDDVLEWSTRLALSGMMEKQQPIVDVIEPTEPITTTHIFFISSYFDIKVQFSKIPIFKTLIFK
ncbi:hypothetical protein AAG906_015531 [Vitis piasezkii]